MRTPNDPRTDRIRHPEQQPTDPGPTSGGMGRMGPQPDEPGLEEKLGAPAKVPADQHQSGDAASRGIAGFHPDPFAEELMEGSGGPTTPAAMRLDPDTEGRVNTGTGDQPGNTGGSRTGTPNEPMDTAAPQAADNTGSTNADPDRERSGGMSGGLGEQR